MICDSGNRVFGGSGSSRIAFPECEAMRRARKHSAKPTRAPFSSTFACPRVFAFCIPVATLVRQSFSKIFKRMSHRRDSSFSLSLALSLSLSLSLSVSSFEKSSSFIFIRPFLYHGNKTLVGSFLLPGIFYRPESLISDRRRPSS